MKVRLDHRGIAGILKSAAVARTVKDVAETVAGNVRAQGHQVSSGEELPVKVTTYETDRAAASVALAHPAGRGMQAKYGALTKAAAAAGLEVKSTR